MMPSTSPSDQRLSREPGIVDLDADLGLPRAARLAIGLLLATTLATAVAAILLLAVSRTMHASDADQDWARMPVPIVQTVPSALRAPMGSEAQPVAPRVDLESPDV